ncbi:MAG: hypothetical protein HPY80_00245 [Bacteroidales bacterium]|nr:hypothetical protein [Bacteroidales bacterium]
MAALIRQQFRVNPYKLSDEEFCKLGAEALWLKEYDITNLKEAVRIGVYEAFAGKK